MSCVSNLLSTVLGGSGGGLNENIGTEVTVLRLNGGEFPYK